MTIVLPLILNTYRVFYYVNYQYNHTDKDALIEIEKEMEGEKAPQTIPVILFGLGILLTKISKKNVLKGVIPYLISSLLLGTVLTSLFEQSIYNWKNLDRLLIFSGLDYMVLTMSFGYMFMSIILTLYQFK